MKIVYFVITVIFAAASWVCTQTTWQDQYILHYIFMFLTGWFLCLVFLYQEENESSKKYTVFTPYNLIYVIILTVAIIMLSKYNLKYWRTSEKSFYKLVAIVNAVQCAAIIIFYKIRDIYHHM